MVVYLSVDQVVVGQRHDFVEGGEQRGHVLTKIVVVLSISSPCVQQTRLDHKLEQKFKRAEAFLNRLLSLRAQ